MTAPQVPVRAPESQTMRVIGLVALIVGVLAFLVEQVSGVIRLFALLHGAGSPLTLYAGNYVAIVLAAAAIVLGAIAWQRRAGGAILGAIATGVGVIVVVPIVANVVELAAFRF